MHLINNICLNRAARQATWIIFSIKHVDLIKVGTQNIPIGMLRAPFYVKPVSTLLITRLEILSTRLQHLEGTLAIFFHTLQEATNIDTKLENALKKEKTTARRGNRVGELFMEEPAPCSNHLQLLLKQRRPQVHEKKHSDFTTTKKNISATLPYPEIIRGPSL